MSEQILATDKVKRETGLAHVFASLNILCPYGQKALRGAKPFMPGEEEQLRDLEQQLQKAFGDRK